MSVCAGRQAADTTSALSHVFPLERPSVRGFVPSIIFYFCLLSWFTSCIFLCCHFSPFPTSTLHCEARAPFLPLLIVASLPTLFASAPQGGQGHSGDRGKSLVVGVSGNWKVGGEGGWGRVHHLTWMGNVGDFPQGQGPHVFISRGVTTKFYRVLCSDDERDQQP